MFTSIDRQEFYVNQKGPVEVVQRRVIKHKVQRPLATEIDRLPGGGVRQRVSE